MTPKLVELQRFDRHLKEQSHSIYCGVLRRVLQASSHHSFAVDLIQLLDRKDYKSLLAYADTLSSQMFEDATQHLVANQLASLIRKYPWVPTLVGTDPEQNAKDIFLKAERRCARLNTKFHLLSTLRNPREYYLQKARSFILNCIGSAPNLGRIWGMCDFGPGASLGCHGDATSFGRKISLPKLTVTPGAQHYAFDALWSHDQLRDRFLISKRFPLHDHEIVCVDPSQGFASFRKQCDIVQNNKLSFVPKTAKVHRTIAVEPVLNTFLQKGIDQDLRLSLKRVGIDLRYQDINAEMARKGSLDITEDSFCTIDLSSASDSISIGLVQSLLPSDWFSLLNRTRSPSYDLDGTLTRYHKFCSMGNGFCFPLQTLIFASLAHACGAGICGTDYRVYGDDIVVRKSFFAKVCSLLKFCGFTLNRRKTFSDGPFRESCGSDWYRGEDVRPYTLDHRLDSLQAFFKFLNLSRRSSRTSYVCAPAYHFLIEMIPDKFRLWRPFPGNPDTGIDPLDFYPRFARNAKLRKGLNCYSWLELCIRPIQDRMEIPVWGVYAAALRGHDSSALFTFRRRTKTSMRYVSHSGASSTWLPPSRL